MKLVTILIIVVCALAAVGGAEPTEIQYSGRVYPLYPKACDGLPEIPSPYRTDGGLEVITALQKDGSYVLVPVTIEDEGPTLIFGISKMGKGRQLLVDADDFPALAETGFHSEEELDRTKKITGRAVEEITRLGRPQASSSVGFMAADEDIISVLKGDNRLVQRMGLTHSEMARPLFHIWNLILKEYEAGRIVRKWDNIQCVLYAGGKVRFGDTYPTKGFQQSIFNDEITGTFTINLYRDVDEQEKAFLRARYPQLGEQEVAEMLRRLSRIMTGEMEPYYAMRYGFYEGHTDFRVDPVAIAFIFGLRNLGQIETAFAGRLDEVLGMHSTRENLPGALHLSAAEVLQAADKLAAEKMARYEKFDLQFYPERTARYDAGTKKWRVFYMRRPNRRPGDHFGIYVDDATKQLQFIGGR